MGRRENWRVRGAVRFYNIAWTGVYGGIEVMKYTVYKTPSWELFCPGGERGCVRLNRAGRAPKYTAQCTLHILHLELLHYDILDQLL